MSKKLKITQVRSLIGSQPKHRLTMRAIGFHHHQETLLKEDTPQLRGMLHQVRHLVRVEQTEKGKPRQAKPAARTPEPAATKKPEAARTRGNKPDDAKPARGESKRTKAADE
jgi:large subunit ribosomal protein L30